MQEKTYIVHTSNKKEILDLTPQLDSFIQQSHIKNGVLVVSALHTTCCVTTGEIGEGTEEDLLEVVEKMVPQIKFRHAHDPSHAWSHMASSILGASKSFIIKDQKLELGTWQSILLVELDGPRERKIQVTILPLIS